MTGTWETRLDNLAHGGLDWEFPAQQELRSTLTTLQDTLGKAASEPGLTGMSGDAAVTSLDDASVRADRVVRTVQQVQTAVRQANRVRERAQTDLGALPSGELSGGEQALIAGATAGATILFGPFAIIAGVAAAQNASEAKAAFREKQAQTAVKKAGDGFAAIFLPTELAAPGVSTDPGAGETPPGGGPGTPGYGPPGGGHTDYPDWDVDPIQQVAVVNPQIVICGPGFIPPPNTTVIPVDPAIYTPPPTTGSPSLVGSGSLAGGGSLGGLSSALVMGAGGAGLLTAGSRLGGASMFGAGASRTAPAGSGGLLGGARTGAAGTPAAGRGGAARAGSGGLLGSGQRAGGAPGRGGAGGAGGRGGVGVGGRGGAAGAGGTGGRGGIRGAARGSGLRGAAGLDMDDTSGRPTRGAAGAVGRGGAAGAPGRGATGRGGARAARGSAGGVDPEETSTRATARGGALRPARPGAAADDGAAGATARAGRPGLGLGGRARGEKDRRPKATSDGGPIAEWLDDEDEASPRSDAAGAGGRDHGGASGTGGAPGIR